MSRIRGAEPTGMFLIGEGAIAAVAALLFLGAGIQRLATYTTSGDDYADGISVLLIGVTFLIAVVLAAYAPAAVLIGRAVKRGVHSAWIAGLVLSAAQMALAFILWPLVLPLALLGAAALLLLLLPETRSECAPPPVLEDV
ncbi:MAG TPA: hypothetical protein VF137_03465 [Candidatus Dormibacteraeota bacterium]